MAQNLRLLLGADLFADSWVYLNDTVGALRSKFSGSSAPQSPVAFQDWFDSSTGLYKIRNAANDGWITIGPYAEPYFGALGRSGGSLIGALDMNSNPILNVGLGSGASAARQQDVDAKAPLASPAFTGQATIDQDPAGSTALVRRGWSDGRYLQLAGGVLTGGLTLSSYAGAAYHPVVLEQLQNFIAFSPTLGHGHTGTDAKRVKGADLDSGAATAGQVLEALGGGAAGWVSAQAQPMRFLETPVQLYSGLVLATYQTVDVSANTDTDTYAAILRVYSDIVDTVTLRFRKNGSAVDTTALDWGPIVGQNVFNVFVELSAARVFQWRSVVQPNSNAFKIHLVGYMRKNF